MCCRESTGRASGFHRIARAKPPSGYRTVPGPAAVTAGVSESA
jgi:hypothetical protein